MKILMTADTVGGVWTYVAELAECLSVQGVQAVVATMGPAPNKSQRQQIAAIPGALLYESDYRLEWMDHPWRDVHEAGEWLLSLADVVQPDVIHLNGYVHGALQWESPVLVVAHSCVLSWWLAVKGEAAPARTWHVYRERVEAGIQAADFVVAPSDAMLGAVQQLYGRKRQMRAVANGRNPELFHSAPIKEPFVLSAGRLWDEAKNVAALQRVASQVDWPICLAGSVSGPAGESREPDLNDCRLLGCLSAQEFARLLGRASIFCLPARYEPFGLSILEAALSGCALVLGDIPSLREIWDGAAVFVSPNDDSQITGAVNGLIRDPEQRMNLAQRANQRALHFTAARMAAEYMEIYAMLLRERTALLSKRMSACAS